MSVILRSLSFLACLCALGVSATAAPAKKSNPIHVVVWDERCTNHRALSDHFPSRRLVRRCTVGAAVPAGVR